MDAQVVDAGPESKQTRRLSLKAAVAILLWVFIIWVIWNVVGSSPDRSFTDCPGQNFVEFADGSIVCGTLE